MQDIRVVLERAPRQAPEAAPVRQLRRVRWGLVPAWAKDDTIGARMINARSETLTEKPAFKRAAAKRRCLVPMDGYYEWAKSPDGSKTPFFLHAGGDLIAAAGLYELRPDPTDPEQWLWTATVATRPATDALGHIHERSPVLVPPDRVDAWLDPNMHDLAEVAALLADLPEPHLEPRQVATAAGRSPQQWATCATTVRNSSNPSPEGDGRRNRSSRAFASAAVSHQPTKSSG